MPNKKDEKANLLSSNYFEVLFELSPDFLFINNIKTGNIVNINKRACDYYGYSKEEFKQLLMADVEMDLSTIKTINNSYKNMAIGEIVEFEGVHKKKNGNTFPVSINICKLDDQIELATIRDITNSKLLDEVRSHISVATSNQVGIDYIKEVAIQLSTTLNADFVLVGSYSEQDAEIVNTIALCERDKIVDNIQYSLAHSPCLGVLENNSCTYLDGINKLFPKHSLLTNLNIKGYSGIPIKNNRGEVFGLLVALFKKPIKYKTIVEPLMQIYASKIAIEIERIQLEDHLDQSIKNWKDIDYALNQAAIVSITDVRGKITYVNDTFCKISKYQRHELLGQDHRLISSDFHPKELWKDLWRTIANGNVWHGEVKNKAKDGSYYWVKTTIVPKLDNKGKPIAYTSIRTDITIKKEAELQLIKSSEEKEVMLKEIHHRVKNNLQVITSLLSLQSNAIDDDAVKEVFDQSVFRIKSMSIIHEMLYQSNNLSRINYNKYLFELGTYLITSITGDNKIKLNIDADNIFLNVNTAVPMGLLINEVITNSLKHAFTKDEKGEITISLISENEDLLLKIGDNGKGIEDFNKTNSKKSLGISLITSLPKQLKGSFELDNTKKGTHYIFHLKNIR